MTTTIEHLREALERWPGYEEQSWQERFAELDRRHSEFVQKAVASLTTSSPTDDVLVLVPTEPTEDMLEAGEEARRDNTDVYLDGSEVARDVVPKIWAAMVAQALSTRSPSVSQDAGDGRS